VLVSSNKLLRLAKVIVLVKGHTSVNSLFSLLIPDDVCVAADVIVVEISLLGSTVVSTTVILRVTKAT
jgi:hypothetical protein